MQFAPSSSSPSCSRPCRSTPCAALRLRCVLRRALLLRLSPPAFERVPAADCARRSVLSGRGSVAAVVLEISGLLSCWRRHPRSGFRVVEVRLSDGLARSASRLRMARLSLSHGRVRTLHKRACYTNFMPCGRPVAVPRSAAVPSAYQRPGSVRPQEPAAPLLPFASALGCEQALPASCPQASLRVGARATTIDPLDRDESASSSAPLPASLTVRARPSTPPAHGIAAPLARPPASCTRRCGCPAGAAKEP